MAGLRLLLAALLAAVILASASTAWASAERITNFHAQVTVRADAVLEVVEKITVTARGREIKRGIIREFPTNYRTRLGDEVRVGFRLKKVLRDGRSESYHTENRSNGIAVYIGEKSVFLKPGSYTYTIVYETDRQLGYFSDYDELYWNVTGNGWTFAIDRVEAVINLPPGAKILKDAAYTGPQGAKGKNFSVQRISQTKISFTTTKPLTPKEGLTVAVAWPKGLVYEPSFQESLLRDHKALMAGLAGLAALLLYYLIFWFKVGRDPAKGVIVPLYQPPAGMSPAAVRFISHMKFDQKAAAVALIDMAVKGYVTIEETQGEYVLQRTWQQSEALSPGERKMARKLFAKNEALAMDSKNHRTFTKARETLKETLETEYDWAFFRTNRGYFLGGLGLTLLTLIGLMLLVPDFATAGFMSIWLFGWSFGCVFLAVAVFRGWRKVFSGGGSKAANLGATMFITLTALPVFGGEILGLLIFAQSIPMSGILVCVALALVNILFFNLLKAPTKAGKKLLDQLEGFKAYLTVAEKDRLNLLNPPEDTPALFEKYLPYAMALNVENQWGERFAKVLAKTRSGEDSYAPSWFPGSSWDSSEIEGFSNTLSSSFTGAVSSASTASNKPK